VTAAADEKRRLIPPHYDRERPEGGYQSDAFFLQLTPAATVENRAQLTPEELADWRRSHFQLFRFDIERAVKIARLRTQRENETEPARKQANELLQDIGPASSRVGALVASRWHA
jgi:hypothetical protein